MQNNVFLCVTEYHVLLSIMVSTEVFGADNYSNSIILCNGGRFKDVSVYNLAPMGNIRFDVAEEKSIVSYAFMDRIESICTNALFLFNLNYPHFTYLAYILKKKSVPTSLVQDGLGLYMYLPFTLRERLSNCKWSFSFLRKIGIKDLRFMLKCYGLEGVFGKIFNSYDVIAKSSIISIIWLTAPEQAQYAKEKVKRIPVFSELSKDRARVFFKYERDNSYLFRENDVLFVDQRIDGTSIFLKELSERYPNSTIYVKLHPRSPRSWSDDFKMLPNIRIIDNMRGIPLELLIQSLKRVVVVSAYSAALLMDNPDCKFYYTYPWYAQRGYGKGEFEEKSIVNPTKHIKVIASLEEMEMY